MWKSHNVVLTAYNGIVGGYTAIVLTILVQ